MSNAIQVVPSNLQVPAHLQSADIAASIAAANAAAAGGVRAGGFPSISIKANKFSIRDGDEVLTLMNPPTAPGQPALPMMCLEVVVVDANPALSHTFFEGEYVEGENKEPSCRSANGVVPDADVVQKQSPVCATCPQYQWGAKLSKLTGKPVRACSDSKQMAVIPAGDLNYKMLGLAIKAGSLKNWGTYIQALSGRGYGVSTLVTNITFDQQSNGVLQFTFNRFLTEAEFHQVNARKAGDDVKVIVAQSRALAAPALPAPANLGLPPPETAAPAHVATVIPITPAVAQPAAVVTGFGAAPAEAAAPPITPPVAASPFDGQPPHVTLAVNAAGGLDTPAGLATYKALTGIDYVAEIAPPVEVSPFEGQPAHVEAAVNAAGGLHSHAGQTTYKALTGQTYPPAATGAGAAPADEPAKRSRKPRTPAPAAAVTPPPADDLSHIPANIQATINAVGANSAAGLALIAAYPKPAAAPIAETVETPALPGAGSVTTAAPATQTGFGAAVVTPAPVQPTAQVVAAGASLAEKLRAKLGLPAQAAA